MLQAMSLLHQSCSLSPLSTCSKHLKSSITIQTQTHYISIAQVLQLPVGPRFPDLWMADFFFHLHGRLIFKKTWPLTCLLPFYFYLHGYSVVSMLVAFSFILLSFFQTPVSSKCCMPWLLRWFGCLSWNGLIYLCSIQNTLYYLYLN